VTVSARNKSSTKRDATPRALTAQRWCRSTTGARSPRSNPRDGKRIRVMYIVIPWGSSGALTCAGVHPNLVYLSTQFWPHVSLRLRLRLARPSHTRRYVCRTYANRVDVPVLCGVTYLELGVVAGAQKLVARGVYDDLRAVSRVSV
jgi:hypothetical protein